MHTRVLDGSHDVARIEEARPLGRCWANATVVESVGGDGQPRCEWRQQFGEFGDVSCRAVFEALEHTLANPRLSAVDACDHVHLGHAQCTPASFDVLFEAVLPDLGLPPG